MFVLNIRYSIRVKHLHFAFGCFSVCFVQTELIMLCITVPTYLYLFSNYKPLLHCVLMQTCIYIHFTVSPSAHCRVQNTHGDRVLSGRRGVGEHQTTWLIRQCVDCICFPFVSHRLHWRRSAVIKPLSETEIGESWGEAPQRHYEMRTTAAEWQELGRTMQGNGNPPIRNILL